MYGQLITVAEAGNQNRREGTFGFGQPFLIVSMRQHSFIGLSGCAYLGQLVCGERGMREVVNNEFVLCDCVTKWGS